MTNRLNQNSIPDEKILRYTPEGYLQVNIGDKWLTYHWARELFDAACAHAGRTTELGKILNRAWDLHQEQMALQDQEEAERIRQQGLN